MRKWLRRVRGAIGMGVTWAAAWALTGLLIGVTSILLPWLPWWDGFFEVWDAPLPAMAVPGFVGGMLFSVVLGIAGRHRSFRELSLPRFAAWGALGGLLLSMVPDLMMTVGLASPGPDSRFAPWQLAAVISVPMILLSTVSASGSLLLARRAERRALLRPDAETGADPGGDTSDAELDAGGEEALPAGARTWSPAPRSATSAAAARRSPPIP